MEAKEKEWARRAREAIVKLRVKMFTEVRMKSTVEIWVKDSVQTGIGLGFRVYVLGLGTRVKVDAKAWQIHGDEEGSGSESKTCVVLACI